MLWQCKELHPEYKIRGWRENDFITRTMAARYDNNVFVTFVIHGTVWPSNMEKYNKMMLNKLLFIELRRLKFF